MPGESNHSVQRGLDQAVQRGDHSGYHHGSLPQVLIEVSLDLIAEHGLDGFSLVRAAKAAGVSPAAPYRHFENKAALLGAIARTGYAQLGRELREAADRHPEDPVEALLELGSAYVDFVVARPAMSSVMFTVRGRARRATPASRRSQSSVRRWVGWNAPAGCGCRWTRRCAPRGRWCTASPCSTPAGSARSARRTPRCCAARSCAPCWKAA
ncbi:hypothetical protein BJF78_03920 [Pseudonocardia sp. CNS-139]|nr:hypothetical protein BJF78_03920 [Pseudonocardia sp. CNS-139]